MMNDDVFQGSPEKFAQVVWEFSNYLSSVENRPFPPFFDLEELYAQPRFAVGIHKIIVRFRNEVYLNENTGNENPGEVDRNPATGEILAQSRPDGKSSIVVNDMGRSELKEMWQKCRAWLIENDWIQVSSHVTVETLDTKPAVPAVPASDLTPTTQSHEIEGSWESVFRQIGDYWEIRYKGGKICHLKHTKGMTFIVRLLQNQGKTLDAIQLVSFADRSTPVTSVPMGRVKEDIRGGNLALSPSNEDTKLDEQAKREYQKRLTDIVEERKEAEEMGDTDALERLDNEVEWLTKEIAAGVGRGGRLRTFGSESARARTNITMQIRRAIKGIRKYDPDLAEHLDTSITTGAQCRYEPSPPVDWKF